MFDRVRCPKEGRAVSDRHPPAVNAYIAHTSVLVMYGLLNSINGGKIWRNTRNPVTSMTTRASS